jgi:hypothetical protein
MCVGHTGGSEQSTPAPTLFRLDPDVQGWGQHVWEAGLESGGGRSWGRIGRAAWQTMPLGRMEC